MTFTKSTMITTLNLLWLLFKPHSQVVTLYHVITPRLYTSVLDRKQRREAFPWSSINVSPTADPTSTLRCISWKDNGVLFSIFLPYVQGMAWDAVLCAAMWDTFMANRHIYGQANGGGVMDKGYQSALGSGCHWQLRCLQSFHWQQWTLHSQKSRCLFSVINECQVNNLKYSNIQ